MRTTRAPFAIGLTLLVLAASAALAAPAPLPAFLAAPGAASPVLAALLGQPPATPADVGGPCGIPSYFCQSCSPAGTQQRLCSTKICGTFVIVSCGDCSPHCILPG